MINHGISHARRAQNGARTRVIPKSFELEKFLQIQQRFRMDAEQVSFRFPRSCLRSEYGPREGMFPSWLRQPY